MARADRHEQEENEHVARWFLVLSHLKCHSGRTNRRGTDKQAILTCRHEDFFVFQGHHLGIFNQNYTFSKQRFYVQTKDCSKKLQHAVSPRDENN